MTISIRSNIASDSATHGRAGNRLHALMSRRADLKGAFLSIWSVLGDRLAPAEIEVWSEAVFELINVNAGPRCLTAYWRLSGAQLAKGELDGVVAASSIAADICRYGGARATAMALDAHSTAQSHLDSGDAVLRWWRAIAKVAKAAPDCVELIVPKTAIALATGDIAAFENFVAVGLKTPGEDRARRRAFFALEDEIARRLLQRDSAGPRFSDFERELTLFLTALWGGTPILRELSASDNRPQATRANIAGPLIRLPEYFPGVGGEAAHHLFRASAAHASAHLALGGLKFSVGSLRPLQVALVNVIEDARVEALAMQRLPGLRALWSPYHVAQPSDLVTAEGIMARLARALFDPSYQDSNGVVSKGRRLFEAAWARLDDPAISRDIGGLLGNDLGQMRVQFNAKTHIVEPAYRDDGLGLWEFKDDEHVAAEAHELAIDATRMERREESDGPPDDRPPERESTGRARAAAQTEFGTVLARYPEWDRASGLERRDWTTVRETAALAGEPRLIEEGLNAAGPLRARIRQLVKRARVGRAVRLKRQIDGHDLDLDAVLEAGIALRTGVLPDTRIFRSTSTGTRGMASVILIDVSESTRDPTLSGGSILAAERIAVAALAEAMTALGDPFALLAFASNGHDNVRLTQVKGFGEPYDRDAVSRLAGLKSGFSTRLGTALRHAGTVLAGVSSYRKMVIALTDGEPSDIDVPDPLDLVEDARRAVIDLRARGIDGFGVVVGPSTGSSANIFGRANAMPVARVEELPSRLSELYFRLSRR